MCLTCFSDHVYRLLEIVLSFAAFIFFILEIYFKAFRMSLCMALSFFSASLCFFLLNDRIPLLACVFQIDVWMSAKGGVG